MEPQLAEKWALSADRRLLRVDLKDGLRFSDGSPVDARTLAPALAARLQDALGRSWTEGLHARAPNSNTIEFELPRPSPLWIESLEEPIRKPGAPGTAIGPFSQNPAAATQLHASADYYLGRPLIDNIDIKTFPSVRSAWAELLRNNIDMLYEVGPDALDSLESSTTVSVFRFVRAYQYNVAFNTSADSLRSATVRQALNFAIDRQQLVRVALNGHGIPSADPLRDNHWAFQSSEGFPYDPQRAARLLNGQHIQFTCLLLTDSVYERIALELKRQLAAVGVDMSLKALPPDELSAAEQSRKYEAALHEVITGPTFNRIYTVWHTHGVMNFSGRGTPTVDAALDKVRDAFDDDQYRQAIHEVQRAFVADPPAILLAWGERARAVSTRFFVPPPDRDRPDVLATLRQWKPRNDDRVASRN